MKTRNNWKTAILAPWFGISMLAIAGFENNENERVQKNRISYDLTSSNIDTTNSNVTRAGVITKGSMHGYLTPGHDNVPATYNAGYSIYSAAWPLLDQYPETEFQSGLAGLWMFGTKSGNHYSDIEGGLGWWRGQSFATQTPKYIMGGVASDFHQWVNGPYTGKGSWDDPQGLYGAAQLSNRLLWPPDGLNLKQGTNGELFGYGWLPLPFTKAKSITAGVNVPTGDNSWTLFLNTKNFKGPAAFILPHFWSIEYVRDPSTAGTFLDSTPSNSNHQLGLENQGIPSVMAYDNNNNAYAKIQRTYFPRNANDHSILINNFTSYSKSALWDSVKAWFNGGSPANSSFNVNGAYKALFSEGRIWPSFNLEYSTIGKIAIDFEAISNDYSFDENCSIGYYWLKQDNSPNPSLFLMPQYYRLDNSNGKKWVPVDENSVPLETGLKQYVFPAGHQYNQTPHTTPSDSGGCWKNPGPVAGPYRVSLQDGSTLTYYWYRFADQPSMFKADLSSQEREQMQSYIEKIHQHWTIDQDYIAPPSAKIALAEIDPALIVMPPSGLEIGYVPVVTKQEKSSIPLTYTLTVTSGTGTGKYAAGANVTITANAAPSGKVFEKWVINSGSPAIANKSAASTTLTMPAGAVTVTATYIAVPTITYPLTVNSGNGDGSYKAGQVVTITADAAPNGQVFSRWAINTGSPTIANMNVASTTLAMPAGAVTVTATYINNNNGGPAGYTWCAFENQSYTFTTKVDVAYGANGKFNYKSGITGTITFNNATFGDPIVGVFKSGYYKKVVSAVAQLYEHTYYGGYVVNLAEGSYTVGQLAALGMKNDDISSLKVASGYSVELYSDDNYGGKKLVRTGDDPNLVDDGFNDVLSSVKVTRTLSIDAVLGTYVRQPPTNTWHTGVIERVSGALRWRNTAGVSWPLTPDLANNRLLTNSQCPYYSATGGNAFTLVTKQNSNGSIGISGFQFLGELYTKQ